MSKRTLRRSAERSALKAQRKNEVTQLIAEIPKTMAAAASVHDFNEITDEDLGATHKAQVTTDARIAANRANAQKSTGPTSAQGRATSSLNALKHGLTGNTVLLDSDDADAYQSRLDAHVREFKPVTFEERRLVQSIHDAAWRLDRILNLESTIYAKGRIELHACFSELPENQRKSFINLEIAQRNAKQLSNLHIQEARLQRQRARDIAALKLLIKERLAEDKATAETPADPSTGFVFESPKSTASQPEFRHTIPLDEAA